MPCIVDARLCGGADREPPADARVAQVNGAGADVREFALVVVDAGEAGAGQIEIGLRRQARADERRHRAVDEPQRQKIAAAQIDRTVELTGPEQQRRDAVAALAPQRPQAPDDLGAADAQARRAVSCDRASVPEINASRNAALSRRCAGGRVEKSATTSAAMDASRCRSASAV